MKKALAILLTGIMVLGTITGCGSSGNSSSASSESGTASSEETAGEAAESTDEKKSIVIAVPDPESSYIYQAAEEFAKRANEYSGGSLEFSVSGNGSLYGGDTAAGIKQLSAGSLQMLILASSVYASFEPGYNVISVPFMFDDQQQLLDYLNSDVGTELMNRTSEMGIKTVGSWTRSMRKVTNSKRPVTGPEDLKGMVLRVPNNSLYVEFFGACGAVTTPMNFSEVYNALQLNTLDGQENPIDVPYSNKFYEVQSYISATDHMADAWVVGMNNALFESLSANQQEAVLKAGEEVQQWNVEFMATEDEAALQVLLDNGMEYNEITEEGRQQFVEISQSCYDKFKELIADDELFEATAEFCGKN